MRRTARTLWHLMRADYLERVRGHAFLVTLGFSVWFAYISLPPNHSKYVTMQIAGSRGLYNSAWIGVVVAIMTTTFLAIAGFYVVKNAVERDRRTGVGQILAATPLTRPLYTLGKASSNFAVLATMVLAVAIAALAMQLVRGEDRHLDLIAVLAPCVIVTLPAMAVVGAVAVLFETIPALSGGLGNVVYFFALILVGFAPTAAVMERGAAMNDVFGNGVLVPAVLHAQAHAFPAPRGEHAGMSVGFNIQDKGQWDLRIFRFEGVPWTVGGIAGRGLWLLVAVGIALAAAIPFDRFDTQRVMARQRRGARRAKPAPVEDVREDAAETALERAAPATAATLADASRLAAPVRAAGFLPFVRAELVLLLRGLPRIWLVIAAGLCAAEAFTPLDIARGWILPFAWVWPILLWSGLGSRDRRHQTSALLLSSPHPLGRQLPAAWLAGLALALALGAPVGVRLALGGDLPGLAAWTTGALFAPSMALALGVWSGSGRAFEILYLVLWYIGPMNHVPFLDYVGESRASVAAGAWIWFAAAAAALYALALLGRRRELTR